MLNVQVFHIASSYSMHKSLQLRIIKKAGGIAPDIAIYNAIYLRSYCTVRLKRLFLTLTSSTTITTTSTIYTISVYDNHFQVHLHHLHHLNYYNHFHFHLHHLHHLIFITNFIPTSTICTTSSWPPLPLQPSALPLHHHFHFPFNQHHLHHLPFITATYISNITTTTTTSTSTSTI